MWDNIINILTDADTGLLLFINGCHTPWADSMMLMISDRLTWVPLYMLLLYTVAKERGARYTALWTVLLVVCVTMADQATSGILKPLVARLRPSSLDNPVSAYVHIVNGYRGGRYGFASSHAANTTALACYWLLTGQNRRMGGVLAAVAAAVSLSRVYLGVHYPSDVTAGAATGWFCAKNSADMFLRTVTGGGRRIRGKALRAERGIFRYNNIIRQL